MSLKLLLLLLISSFRGLPLHVLLSPLLLLALLLQLLVVLQLLLELVLLLLLNLLFQLQFLMLQLLLQLMLLLLELHKLMLFGNDFLATLRWRGVVFRPSGIGHGLAVDDIILLGPGSGCGVGVRVVVFTGLSLRS